MSTQDNPITLAQHVCVRTLEVFGPQERILILRRLLRELGISPSDLEPAPSEKRPYFAPGIVTWTREIG